MEHSGERRLETGGSQDWPLHFLSLSDTVPHLQRSTLAVVVGDFERLRKFDRLVVNRQPIRSGGDVSPSDVNATKTDAGLILQTFGTQNVSLMQFISGSIHMPKLTLNQNEAKPVGFVSFTGQD